MKFHAHPLKFNANPMKKMKFNANPMNIQCFLKPERHEPESFDTITTGSGIMGKGRTGTGNARSGTTGGGETGATYFVRRAS